MDTDMAIFADLLASLIAKYADKIDLESLPSPSPPDPPQESTD